MSSKGESSKGSKNVKPIPMSGPASYEKGINVPAVKSSGLEPLPRSSGRKEKE